MKIQGLNYSEHCLKLIANTLPLDHNEALRLIDYIINSNLYNEKYVHEVLNEFKNCLNLGFSFKTAVIQLSLNSSNYTKYFANSIKLRKTPSEFFNIESFFTLKSGDLLYSERTNAFYIFEKFFYDLCVLLDLQTFEQKNMLEDSVYRDFKKVISFKETFD